MNLLNLFIALVILFIVLAIIIKIITPKKAPAKSIFDFYSDHGKIWLKNMWVLYTSGRTWEKNPKLNYELYEKTFGVNLSTNEFGVKYNAYIKDIGITENALDLPENDIRFKIGDLFFWLGTYLDLRFDYQYKPLRGTNPNEVLQKYGLHLTDSEILYYNTTKIDCYEEHGNSIQAKIHGIRYQSGDTMTFNTGNLSPVINNLTGFLLQDRGSLYITNTRIIFLGDENRQNRSIPLRDILELELFKDGILLGKATGHKTLIFFPEAINVLIQPDGMGPVLRVLHRLFNGTQNEDVTPESMNVLD